MFTSSSLKRAMQRAVWKPKRRSVRHAAGLCLVLAMASGCASNSATDGSRSEVSGNRSPVVGGEGITIGVFTGSTFSIPYPIAVGEGFFALNGLNAKIVKFTTGPALISGVISHSVDLSALSPLVLTSTQLQGQSSLRATGPSMKSSTLLVASTASVGIEAKTLAYPETVRLLKGKRVGVPALGAAGQVLVDSLLVGAGMMPGDVTYLAVGGESSALAALKAGRIDAYTTSASGVATFEQNGVDVAVLAGGEKGGSPDFNGVRTDVSATTTDFTGSGAKFERYCNAMKSTIAWIADPKNKEAGAKYIAAETGLDATAALGVWNAESPLWTLQIGETAWTNTTKIVPKAQSSLPYSSSVVDCP
jgi:NitT/TauT family transport system substrate-binding protein